MVIKTTKGEDSQYARSLIEASLDPLVTVSREGKITDMNNALERMTGKAREELRGTNFFDYFTDPQMAREVYREVFAKGFVTDYPLTMRDHRKTDVLFNGSVYKDEQGNVLGAVVVARDITEHKKIEKELIEARVFAELATAFAEKEKLKAESATRIAEDAVKAKQQFLSNMSHEIRTPMNAIIGFTKVLLRTSPSVKQKEYLDAIKVSGDSLIVLINDILDLAKVDAGKTTFEETPFKLASSISAMLNLFEIKIQEKNLDLVKEYDSRIPEVLVGDPVRLHQIIQNLVSNAVKFTNKGKITVSVCLEEEEEASVLIIFSVTDTGIGIAESKLEKIFENFQQASSSTSRIYGGTGLGLAIVKQLVESQGGHVSVTSAIDAGSSFSFKLRFKKTNAQVKFDTVSIDRHPEIKGMSILVVEDIPLNQLLMKTLLDDFGLDSDIVGNGKLALEQLKSKQYDVILMDLQMPEMNGFETTEYIRNVLKSKVPIIALTADVTTVDLEKCKAVGMNDYIAKPVDERLLYSKIMALIMPLKREEPEPGNGNKGTPVSEVKSVDLNYLIGRTKSNPKLMQEMILAYLKQTPPLIMEMKQSFKDKNWKTLQGVMHKMLPSFTIMGIHPDFEAMVKKIQKDAGTAEQSVEFPDMIKKIEHICLRACADLNEELTRIKTTING